MINKKQFLESLYAYTDFILWCEDRLRKRFGFEGIPWANQKITGRRGSFEIEGNNFEFFFHGSGCTINYQRLELHYDVNITQVNYIEIAHWKLMRFIVTYLKLEKEVDMNLIDEFLIDLNGSGPVVKDDYGGYVINFDWYRNYHE
jgi:hypothetical protein